jgi:hypothetical protein
MEQPARRRRFQIHLSTAVMLMITAGGLIWGNTRAEKLPSPSMMGLPGYSYCGYGWPIPAIVVNETLGSIDLNYGIVIALDTAAALTILFAVWFVCERLIRRREARKAT